MMEGSRMETIPILYCPDDILAKRVFMLIDILPTLQCFLNIFLK